MWCFSGDLSDASLVPSDGDSAELLTCQKLKLIKSDLQQKGRKRRSGDKPGPAASPSDLKVLRDSGGFVALGGALGLEGGGWRCCRSSGLSPGRSEVDFLEALLSVGRFLLLQSGSSRVRSSGRRSERSDGPESRSSVLLLHLSGWTRAQMLPLATAVALVLHLGGGSPSPSSLRAPAAEAGLENLHERFLMKMSARLFPSGVSGDLPHVYAGAGQAAVLPCGAAASSSSTCSTTSWYFRRAGRSTPKVESGEVVQRSARGSRISLAPNCSLVLTNLAAEDAGLYHCAQEAYRFVFISVLQSESYLRLVTEATRKVRSLSPSTLSVVPPPTPFLLSPPSCSFHFL